MNNHNAAKLTDEQVQQTRDLHSMGFRTSNIARAFGLCARTIADNIHKRSWAVLPDVPTSLPLLNVDAVMELRLRKIEFLNRGDVNSYAEQLAAHHGVSISLILLAWTRPARTVDAEEMSCVGTTDRGIPLGMGVNL